MSKMRTVPQKYTAKAPGRFAVGVVTALAGAVLWGFSGTCAQLTLSAYGASPLFITAVRTLVAAVLLLAFAVVRYSDALVDIVRCDKLRLRLVLFGVGLFLSQSTFAASVAHTNAGTATVLQSLATVFVMVIACSLARRLPRPFEMLGVVCAVASTWFIATQGNPGAFVLPFGGLFWGIVNALAVTLYIMMPKPLYDRWPSFPVIACGMTVAAIVAALCWTGESLIGGSFTVPAFDAFGWGVLLVGIGVLGTACAFGLYLHGVAIVGSINGSLLGAAEPVSAMVITAAWLGTAFTGADWLGLALMIAMIVLVSLSPQRAK